MPARLHSAVALGGLLWLGLEPAAGAGPSWLKLRSAHFELYTTAGERTGRQTILYFEQVRGFFEKATGLRPKSGVETRIIVFQSEREFRAYRMNEFASAYYASVRDRDYIVIQRMDSGRDPSAAHEYMHLLIRHSGTKLPAWLNEGYAQLYSSLTPSGDSIHVGGVPPWVGATLTEKIWLKLDRLLAVDHDSPEYNQKEHAGIFYAQSWALTHMLNLDEAYRTRTSAFLEALHNGGDSPAAFLQVYGKSLQQVNADLNRYVRGASVPAALFPFRLDKAAETPEVQPAAEWESGLVLAGVLEAIKKREQARQAYLDLQQKFPTRWEAPAALGYLTLRARGSDPGPFFERAVELGSTDPELYYDYAVLLTAQERSAPRAIPLLRRAVELKPDFDEAHYQLGFLLLRDKSYQEALVHFSRLRQVSPDRASRLFSAAAYAHFQLGQKDAALQAAANAKKTAQSAEDVEAAERLWNRLNAPARMASALPSPEPRPQAPSEPDSGPELGRESPIPTPVPVSTPAPISHRPPRERVEGTLERFDCLGKIARLRLLVAGERLALAILDPNAIVIERPDGGAAEFACGPQKGTPVVVEYEPGPDPELGTKGVVRGIKFTNP